MKLHGVTPSLIFTLYGEGIDSTKLGIGFVAQLGALLELFFLLSLWALVPLNITTCLYWQGVMRAEHFSRTN